MKADDENLSTMVALESAARNSESPMSYKKEIFLHFALGKCFDDIGDYDQAYSHFIEGCKLKCATFEYDAEQMMQRVACRGFP